MKRYFEFQDSKSYKFWQIEIDDSSLTVTYGKIGTTGQEKTTDFGAVDKAEKEMAKLIAEKTKKGYVEKTTASAKKNKKRIEIDYDDEEEGKTIYLKLKELLDSPQAALVDSLVFGGWEDSCSLGPDLALCLLAEQADKLPLLTELFIGDIDSEECEISWINQGDYTNIFDAFPRLERLHIKGSTTLTLSTKPLVHKNLKALIIECGGLPSAVIDTITKATLPNLEHLELYLGVEDYGFDGSIETLRPLMNAKLFPKLTYLGLANSEIADEIAAEIADAKVLSQLETLDLSKGTLTDAGAQALLGSSEILKLKKLDLHYHYLSDSMIKTLKGLPIQVDLSDHQGPAGDEDDRYPAVTE